MADNAGEGERVLRVLMRFGLDEQSAQSISNALKDQEHDLADLTKQWELLRQQAGLTEQETVTAIQGSITGMGLQRDQILAIGKAYEEKQAAESAAAAQATADLEAESARLKNIDDNTRQIASSFTNMIGLGRAMSELGRAGTIFGTLFNDADLKRTGQIVTGLGDLVMVVGRLPQVLRAAEDAWAGLNAVMAAGGIAAAGATAGIAAAGVLLVAALPQQEFLKEGSRAGYALGRQLGIPNIGAQLGLDAATKTAEDEGRRGPDKFSDIGKSIDKFVEDFSKALEKAIKKQQEQINTFIDYQDRITQSEKQYGAERVKIEEETQKQVNNIIKRYARADEAAWDNYLKAQAKADRNYADQRLKILTSGADQELKAERTYYDERTKAAESYGIEVARAEEAHQVEMRRLSEDHTKNLRKLADARDALGIEDENERYNTERSRAEEDYQRQARQRNQDYARQMGEMEKHFQDEQKVRKDDRQKQLAELTRQKAEDDAQRTKDYEAAKIERDNQLRDDLDQAKQNGKDKLDQAAQQHQDELNQLNDAWNTRRRQLGLWLAGEQTQWDNYMKARQEDLQKWIDTHLTQPGGTPSTAPTTTAVTPPMLHAQQVGGYQPYTGPTLMHAGEFVANAATTRALERLVGGALTQQNILGATGSAQAGPVTISVNQTFSGQESSPEVYRSIVYQTMTEVIDKAMRQ